MVLRRHIMTRHVGLHLAVHELLKGGDPAAKAVAHKSRKCATQHCTCSSHASLIGDSPVHDATHELQTPNQDMNPSQILKRQ